jgi:hypothetical protein
VNAAFYPSGPIVGFTSASTAPTSVQVTSLDGTSAPIVMLTNIDATNDAVVGWGVDDTQAKVNSDASKGSNKCVVVPHASSVFVAAGPNAYFSGIALSSTAIIKAQAGNVIR